MSDANEPAFGHGDYVNGGAPGLTKRELFAAMAMQGWLAGISDAEPELMAKDAVAYADALLAALSEKTS